MRDRDGEGRFWLGFWRLMFCSRRIVAFGFPASLSGAAIRIVTLSAFSRVRIRGVVTIRGERDTGRQGRTQYPVD